METIVLLKVARMCALPFRNQFLGFFLVCDCALLRPIFFPQLAKFLKTNTLKEI